MYAQAVTLEPNKQPCCVASPHHVLLSSLAAGAGAVLSLVLVDGQAVAVRVGHPARLLRAALGRARLHIQQLWRQQQQQRTEVAPGS